MKFEVLRTAVMFAGLLASIALPFAVLYRRTSRVPFEPCWRLHPSWLALAFFLWAAAIAGGR